MNTVADARKALAAEPAARKRAREEIDRLWDAAQLVPSDLARATLHLEGLRRALRLLGSLDPKLPDAQVWDATPADARAALALAEGEVPRVAQAVSSGLAAETAVPVAAIARAHANAAAKLNADDRLVSEFDRARAARLGFGLFPVSAVLFLILAPVVRWLVPADLAAGLTFRASSTYGGAPANLLFHTQEEPSPWALVDLQRPTEFSRVVIVNRSDSEQARAVPLVVEVSDDGAGFREVARQTEPFDTWKAAFPSQRARFVRVRADRKTFLHLEAVRVHR